MITRYFNYNTKQKNRLDFKDDFFKCCLISQRSLDAQGYGF